MPANASAESELHAESGLPAEAHPSAAPPAPPAQPEAYAEPAVQDRFWNETVRLPALFERYRDGGDNANAQACFGRMAWHRYWEATQQPKYDPKKRSIISAFQPKSAGTYLHNRMMMLGYTDFWWMFPHRDCHSVCYASDEALEYFLRGGFTCHTHARPDPNILAAFDRAGVEKIWVHLRNPVECVVSAFHHHRGEGHGEGAAGEQRRRQALQEAERQGLLPGMSKSDFVTSTIGFFIDWIAEWLRFARDRPELVVLSYYNELNDPQAMLTRVFDEFGVPAPKDVPIAPVPEDRYRHKTTAGWRHELTPGVQTYVESCVRAELEEFPAFAQLWS